MGGKGKGFFSLCQLGGEAPSWEPSVAPSIPAPWVSEQGWAMLLEM